MATLPRYPPRLAKLVVFFPGRSSKGSRLAVGDNIIVMGARLERIPPQISHSPTLILVHLDWTMQRGCRTCHPVLHPLREPCL